MMNSMIKKRNIPMILPLRIGMTMQPEMRVNDGKAKIPAYQIANSSMMMV